MAAEFEDLEYLAWLNRQSYYQKISNQAEEQTKKNEFLQGYDTELGLSRIQDSAGNIRHSVSITNASKGIKESVRTRGNTWDAMPFVRKEREETLLAQPEIIFGIVSTTSPFPVDAYAFLFDNRINYFARKLIAGFLKNKKVEYLQLNIPEDFESFFDSSNYNFSSIFGYFSIGIKSSDIYLFLGGRNYAVIDISSLIISTTYCLLCVVNFNSKKQTITRINLDNRDGFIFKGVYMRWIRTFLPWVNQVGTSIIKYLGEDNKIYYCAISANPLRKVHLEDVTNIESLEKIFCGSIQVWNLGTVESFQSEQPNLTANIFLFHENENDYIPVLRDGQAVSFYPPRFFGTFPWYGAEGGIVCRFFQLIENSQNTYHLCDIFIPEKILNGSQGQAVEQTEIIFSKEIELLDPDNLIPEIQFDLLPNYKIGDMPPPLDTREVNYKDKKYQASIKVNHEGQEFINSGQHELNYWLTRKDFSSRKFQ